MISPDYFRITSLPAVLGLILLCSSTPGTAWTNDPAPDQIITYKIVDGSELKLNLFFPENHTPADKKSAIVFFHGGGWERGDPDQFYPHSQYLASRGMIAISAQYRLKDTHNATPRDGVMDGVSAIRWVRQHADELGIDPDKIAAGGGSSGGHIAAVVATTTGFEEKRENKNVSYRPDALVLFNPVLDNSPDGVGYDKMKEYWEDISPLHNVDAQTPPAIVFNGTEDNITTAERAEKFRELMTGAGVRSELFLYEGQKHGFFNYSRSKLHYRKTVVEMDRFLTSLGYLSGSPTMIVAE